VPPPVQLCQISALFPSGNGVIFRFGRDDDDDDDDDDVDDDDDDHAIRRSNLHSGTLKRAFATISVKPRRIIAQGSRQGSGREEERARERERERGRERRVRQSWP